VNFILLLTDNRLEVSWQIAHYMCVLGDFEKQCGMLAGQGLYSSKCTDIFLVIYVTMYSYEV